VHLKSGFYPSQLGPQDLAEKVRDNIRKGQKDVEVVAYGPKYWKGKKKTEDGWKEELIEGYYAGFVRVPKDKEPSVTPKP
jgi:membrane-bound lytic murein transglycosylase